MVLEGSKCSFSCEMLGDMGGMKDEIPGPTTHR